MASFGHLAVGLAAARFLSVRSGGRVPLWAASVVLPALSLLPDADVVAFALGIPYEAPFGHRGASHSVVAAFVVAGLAAVALGRWKWPVLLTFWVMAATVVSHGLLDAMTTGGKGIGLLWPFSDARFFLPWRPIPVAPIGVRMLSPRGVHVVLVELALFLPCLIYAGWPRRRPETLG